eukprot:TRINITY_DN92639_c0_g1_i1.p1 TRINITY_DN92639_c0_g1~~TRINITY_DN92639_c0_g1_i1.p1  ORF type:complete len:846 (-),score=104.21 TRINITY_DN92639_c0_g1_i1:37-2574(-)
MVLSGHGLAALESEVLRRGVPKLHHTDFSAGRPSSSLRVFIYDLPEEFHLDMIHRTPGRWGTSSYCDWMLTPCDEEIWAGKASAYRQTGADVQILLKFLRAPRVAPKNANLFVVPFFIRLACLLAGLPFRCAGGAEIIRNFSFGFKQILPYWSPSNDHQHLFLATGEPHTIPVEVVSRPLVLTQGAIWPDSSKHLVVPISEPHAQLQPGTYREPPERTILFWYTGTPNNPPRRYMDHQLQWFARRSLSASSFRCVSIASISNCTTLLSTSKMTRGNSVESSGSSPKTMIKMMQKAVFCPCPPAENPAAGTKRLFDSLAAGCIPVVVSFPGVGGPSWWRPGGSGILRSLPFPKLLDWDSLVVAVPHDELVKGRFVAAVLRLSEAEVLRRQRYISDVRSRFIYDYSGSSLDAFSALIDEIAGSILEEEQQATTRAQSSATGRSFCDIIPRAQGHVNFLSFPGTDKGFFEKRWSTDLGERHCVVHELPMQRCMQHKPILHWAEMRSSGLPVNAWHLYLEACAAGSEAGGHKVCWFPPDSDGVGFPSVRYVEYTDMRPAIAMAKAEIDAFEPDTRRVCRSPPAWPFQTNLDANRSSIGSNEHGQHEPGTLRIVTWACGPRDWDRMQSLLRELRLDLTVDSRFHDIQVSVIRNVSCAHERTQLYDILTPWGAAYSQQRAERRQQMAFAKIPASYFLDGIPTSASGIDNGNANDIVIFMPSLYWLGRELAWQASQVHFPALLTAGLKPLKDPATGMSLFCGERREHAANPCQIFSGLFGEVCSYASVSKCQTLVLFTRLPLLAAVAEGRWQTASDMRWMYRGNGDALDMLGILVMEQVMLQGLEVRHVLPL